MKADNPNKIWERPDLVVVPDHGAYELVLQGEWEVELNSSNSKEEISWKVPVPGDLQALGYPIRTGLNYCYRNVIEVPDYFIGKRIFLQMATIHDDTTILINGVNAGFNQVPYIDTVIELTKYLKPGNKAELTLQCKNRSDSLSNWIAPEGSPGQIGFIHSMKLIALPQSYITRLCYDTTFHEGDDDAFLNIEVAANMVYGEAFTLDIYLSDKEGKVVVKKEGLSIADQISLPVIAPLKWDCEHPNLYTLCVTVKNSASEETQQFIRRVGFRKIEKRGNMIYVNNKKTKLHGIARYSLDPLNGKVFSKEQIEREIRLMKEANINFIRLSVYPEQRCFFDYCDEYGIFLQVCTPVTFQQERYDTLGFPVYRHSCDKRIYRNAYMTQFSLMVEEFRNHPSVMIWEFANESDWGCNLQEEIDYVHRYDPGRLTSGTWGNSYADIFCYHYPQYNEVYDNCALYDEYTHVATHALETLRRDPAIRNAWGLSVQKGWNELYYADGVVGTAIFAMGDFVIMQSDGSIYNASFGQWGIIDKWMREKPEHWLVKKAYSPVRIIKTPVEDLAADGKELQIPVENRYNYSDLNELELRWLVYKQSAMEEFIDVPIKLSLEEAKSAGYKLGHIPKVAPGACGVITIPKTDWGTDDVVRIAFYEESGRLIEVEDIDPGDFVSIVGEGVGTTSDLMKHANVEELAYQRNEDNPEGRSLTVDETDREYQIKGSTFCFTFDKETGLIKNAMSHSETLICGGPFLNYKGLYYKTTQWPRDNTGDFSIDITSWVLNKMSVVKREDSIQVEISGTYRGETAYDRDGNEYGFDNVKVSFYITIYKDGKFETKYHILNPPKYLCCEVGVSYLFDENMQRLMWKRNAAFTVYPDTHIGRPCGNAYLYRKDYEEYKSEPEDYRRIPQYPWAYDEKDFILNGAFDTPHGTNDFRATREHIYDASLSKIEKKLCVRVEADGRDLSVRAGLGKDESPQYGDQIMFYMNHILYYDLGGGSLPGHIGDRAWGNYTYPEVYLSEEYVNNVTMGFFNA